MTSFFPWRRVFLPAALSILFFSPAFAQETKQLAGPPSDFLGGPMVLPDPADVGVRSKAATIPVRLEKSGALWSWEGKLAVDRGERVSMMLLAPDFSRWEMKLRAPGASVSQRAESKAIAVRDTGMGLGSVDFPGRYFAFAGLAEGEWGVSVTSAEAPATSVAKGGAAPSGYLIVSSDSSYNLYSFLDSHETLLGRKVSILAYGFDTTKDSGERAPSVAKGLVETATLTLFSPSGSAATLQLADDGKQGDGAAGDGIFGASFTLAELGEYRAQVMAHGVTPQGNPFLRSVEHAFAVVFPDVAITGAPARAAGSRATKADEHRVTVEIPIAGNSSEGSRYLGFAQLWGTTASGQELPVCWIGGIASPKDGALPLGLDLRWISLAGAQAPFELRDVRVSDVDSSIPLTSAPTLALDAAGLSAAGFATLARPARIDEEMLMGPRPSSGLPPGAMAATSGGKLLLVHGYCSSDVWGPVQSQFTQYAIFYDLHQNRTHDQFANLIKNFGAPFPSYGIVCHSQGGCASLHLYTYYWSGLDYAVGPRLIQSVGTPYQGTALAGNLAVLGQVFGVGCGTNANLTYSGAAAWLAGIPTWARQKVNFYTTSFTDNPWVYDYCSLATDLLLTDPEDGVTEKVKGFLTSGINRGHTYGWCHSSGMRDPAQTTDASRNVVMNANAAR